MIRNLAFACAMCLLPAAAMAQEHSHPAPAAKQHAVKVHRTFPQILMEKHAELNLTEDQVAKLEDLAAKMAEHHKSEMKAGAASSKNHDHAGASKLHEELMAIFNEKQREQVKALMKQHMDACKDGEAMHCKVDVKVKKDAFNE